MYLDPLPPYLNLQQRLFNRELFSPLGLKCPDPRVRMSFQPRIFQFQPKVLGWKVWGWWLGLKILGMKCPTTFRTGAFPRNTICFSPTLKKVRQELRSALNTAHSGKCNDSFWVRNKVTLAKSFYYVNYGSSIITSKVSQIISVTKT